MNSQLERYFDLQESIYYRQGETVLPVLEAISQRYMGDNPRYFFMLRSYSREGFPYLKSGQIDINLNTKLPHAPHGYMAYTAARLWMHRDAEMAFLVNCYGPTRLFVNQKLAYRSEILQDINVKATKKVTVQLHKGWNDFVLRCVKTASGFGCLFSLDNARWTWMNFQAPFKEREGMLSFAYSECFEGSDNVIPPDFTLGDTEASTGLSWYPVLHWKSEQLAKSPLERIFGFQQSRYAYGYTSFFAENTTPQQYLISAQGSQQVAVWIDGNPVPLNNGSASVELAYGSHEMLAESVCPKTSPWQFDISVETAGRSVIFYPPVHIQGSFGSWLYLGTFSSRLQHLPKGLSSFETIYCTDEGKTYWQVDVPNCWVRPSLEEKLFGRWNYPLGVTLYGLLQAGKLLGRKDIVEYALQHITQCTRMYKYALWDAQQYGFPAINNQLTSLEMLDDCGSFASAMLSAYEEIEDEDVKNEILEIADHIADYMLNKQERQSDGAFYRNRPGTLSENTMWADDLYMSTPFLIKYYRLTGNEACLEEVVRQFKLFWKYLYIPGPNVLSHVYDFKCNTATLIPWGRGNGWVLFSLSEILSILPQSHKYHSELLQFFRILSSSYLKLQSGDGMWHQLLTHPDSYEETSCTAMFVCAFARGIRFNWYSDDVEAYLVSARKGWEGLCRNSIRYQGDIYGVCQGSGYSFLPEYYKNDLLPILNDTHGIGIVLLAGTEIEQLKMHFNA